MEPLLAPAVDLNQLHLDAACSLRLDVYVLNADGALLDACLMAAAAALLSLRLPSPSVIEDSQVGTLHNLS